MPEDYYLDLIGPAPTEPREVPDVTGRGHRVLRIATYCNGERVDA